MHEPHSIAELKSTFLQTLPVLSNSCERPPISIGDSGSN